MICEKCSCFLKALGLGECSGSCVVNTSLMSIFLNDLEQRHGEYVKIDFSIILNDRHGYNITTF